MMTYEEACAYLEEIPKFTKKHSLEHTEEFLKRLGNPGLDKKIIHVAGTNGKGSVCAYMQAILQKMGKHTGFFTSPHLIALNERIRVDNVQISNQRFLEVFCKVKETVDGMVREGIAHPSYFEFLFGMGMTAFEAADVEYIILETGLGGRLDATNAVKHPVLTIITSISLDHTAYLGDTIAQIAAEKAGIIKEQVPVVFDGNDEEAAKVIEKRADLLHAECRKVAKNAFEIQEITDKHIAFSRCSAYDKGVIWQVNGCGIYQAMNVSLALEAMELLFPAEETDFSKWQEAVASVTWEGRMEEVHPGVYVDGAHNPGAIEAFAESLQALGEEDAVILFSAVADKEYETMIAYLCQHVPARSYIITEIEDDRRVKAKELSDVFRTYTEREVFVCPKLEDAWQKAMEQKKDGRVYCLGSLYLVGMLKEFLKELGKETKKN